MNRVIDVLGVIVAIPVLAFVFFIMGLVLAVQALWTIGREDW